MPATNTEYTFLNGGGEMGALIRAHQWEGTPLGSPALWPQSLRTTISIILNSRFPMFLFWGPQHLCFYNDAYRPSLGNDGKHPGALGMPGVEVWPEIWEFIKPLIDQVLAGKGATWNEDQLLPIYRNGKMEDVYWTFSYSPVTDESGSIAGVFVTCSETTDKVRSQATLQDSNNQLQFAIEATELGTWDLNPTTGKFRGNARLKEWFGLRPDEEIELTLAISAMVPADRERVANAITTALQYESGGQYNIEYGIINPATGEERIVRAKGRAWFGDDQKPYRFNGTLQDITSQYRARKKVQQSQRELLDMFEQSPVAIATIDKENLTFRTANSFYATLVGRKPEELRDVPLLEALPELRGQGFDTLLYEVIASGTPYRSAEVPVSLVRNNQPETIYVDLIYQPRLGIDNEVTGVLVVATDVTEQVTARKQVEDREARLRSFVDGAPFPIGVYTGKEMRIALANQNILDVWGKGNDVIGKSYLEILPELAGTGIYEQLDGVYTTGIPYHSGTQRIDIEHDGMLKPYYFNYSFTPVLDTDGNIYGVMNTAANVTDLAIARKQEEEAKNYLNGAIELADLGTWSYDVVNGNVYFSNRMRDWFGFSEDEAGFTTMFHLIREDDHEQVAAALQKAMDPAGDGLYNAEYIVTNQLTGKKSIQHAQGKTIFDDNGNPITINGTARDITMQRELQIELEQQVQERTEELGAANEELASANEELYATNEELAQLNSDLAHSNEELAQYAYVASHDLQEPLRKIRIFSGILAANPTLNEGAKETVSKISDSAERMAMLIRDLLEFSRLLKSDSMMRSIDLKEVATGVAQDFELIIEEKGAVVTVNNLPVIDAVSLQMNQLFYNLLGNALKFTSADKTPQIQFDSLLMDTEEVGHYINRPIPTAQYHHITISDNGIGFNVEYAEQIFEVFKRLHGRDSYPGSGIGLALCRRIVANHNGHLFAESEEGKGSVFHLILPDKQESYTSAMPPGLELKK